jgi:uncharacterized protein
MDTFNIVLSEIVITNLLDGVFYSKLICIFNGEEYEIDSRTSDALALAIRFGCPIYIYGEIMETSGIVLIEEPEGTMEEYSTVEETAPETETEKTDYTIYTYKELEKMLSDALAHEDYEKAAKIRDELNKREK